MAWTQRWRNGLSRWQPAGEGGFDPDRYGVDVITRTVAQDFCTQHHYSGACPPTKYCFGLYDLRCDDAPGLVGVVVLGSPMNNKVLTGSFPSLIPNHESLELSRLVLLDEVPANAESWFCAQVFRRASEVGVRGLVAFSDPSERWTGGKLVKRGHLGIVYQALGAEYLGRSTPRTVIILPDDTQLTARARAKVTGGETGSNGVIARLVALGATPPRRGLAPSLWIAAALDELGARREHHAGNHRYAFRVGRTRAERSRTVIGLVARQYPKPELTLVDLTAQMS